MKQKNQQFGRSGLWAACALVCVSGFSQAAPVTSWSYTTDDNFTAATFQPSGSGTTVTSPDVLKWGATGGNFQVDTGDANTNQSALTIGTGVTGASRMGGGASNGKHQYRHRRVSHPWCRTNRLRNIDHPLEQPDLRRV